MNTNTGRAKHEILHMQVRLFHLAMKRWKLDRVRCADVFDEMKIDEYIHDLYGLFHLQGDEAILYDIEIYLKARGGMSWG